MSPGTSKFCNRSSSSGNLAMRSGQCFGANEIRNCTKIRPCPPRVPKTPGSQSTYLASRSLHENDLGTENPKDLETSEDHSLGKTWQRSTSPQSWKAFSVSIRLSSAVATAPATKSQPSQHSLSSDQLRAASLIGRNAVT